MKFLLCEFGALRTDSHSYFAIFLPLMPLVFFNASFFIVLLVAVECSQKVPIETTVLGLVGTSRVLLPRGLASEAGSNFINFQNVQLILALKTSFLLAIRTMYSQYFERIGSELLLAVNIRAYNL